MEVEVNNLAAFGAIADKPPYMLPPEAWSLARNVRYVDGGVETLLGWEQIFGTPGVAPYFLMPVATSSATFWLYMGLTKGYGYDGITHTDITRTVGGNYGASAAQDWTGFVFGGIPVVNNPVDVPQVWATVALGTKLTPLSNWPSTLRTKVLRSYGPYLIALNLIDSGTALPHTLQWSHPADPGGVPSSWDYTDATKDAGRKDFPDVDSGVLVDGRVLQGVFYVYKEAATYKMTTIGTRAIFDFKSFLETTGALCTRAVAVTGDGTKHVVATQDDIIWHNGNQVESVLTGKQRRRLFNEIDPTNYKSSFMFCNPYRYEMWFCYPSSGQTVPDKALVMNYGGGDDWKISEADGITFQAAALGSVEGAAATTWATQTLTWDQDTAPWSQLIRRRVIVASPVNTKFYNFDKTQTRDGAAFACTLQREGLALLGKTRTGEPIVDHRRRKLVGPLWPKVQGGPVNIRVGTQEHVNQGVAWGATVAFNPATMDVANVAPQSGRACAVEYSSTAAVSWRVDGYKYNVEALGEF